MRLLRRSAAPATHRSAMAWVQRVLHHNARQQWLRLAQRVLGYALLWLALDGAVGSLWPGYQSLAQPGLLLPMALAVAIAGSLILWLRAHPRVAPVGGAVLLTAMWGIQWLVVTLRVDDAANRWWHMALALGTLAGILALLTQRSFLPMRGVNRRPLHLVAILGTGVAVLGATLALELESRNSLAQANRLAAQTAADLRAEIVASLAPFDSLAQRWQMIHHFPDAAYRRHEFWQLLARHPELEQVALVSPGGQITEEVSEPYRFDRVLDQVVASAAYPNWRAQLMKQGVAQLALADQLPVLHSAGATGVIGVALPGDRLAGWVVLARTNLTLVAAQTLLAQDTPCCWRITAGAQSVFVSDTPMQSQALETDTIRLPLQHEAAWTVAYHPPLAAPVAGPAPLAEGILLVGLLFTLFLNASQRLAELASFHAGRMRQAATHDSLTGLRNRRALADWLADATVRANQLQRPLAVAVLQVTGIKAINSTFGHEAGDAALCAVAYRLQTGLPADGIVARVSGEEFVLVMVGDAEADARRRMQQCLTALAAPIELGNGSARLRASAGLRVSLGEVVATEAMTLVRDADLALMQARGDGQGACVMYSADLAERFLARQTLRNDLQQAIDQGAFHWHYQPIVDATTGRVRALEALLRWQHPARGNVSPADFVPLAEDTGQIVAITNWCVQAICRDAAALRAAGIEDVPLVLNLSARDFRRDDIVPRLQAALQAAELPPQAIELEITESVLIDDEAGAVAKLHELRALGIGVALDDFGTGYSSLNYLKALPIGKIKIDRTFVESVTSEPRDAAIVHGILAIAHKLELVVVAEGVETVAQLAYLMRAGCDQLQGFLLERPQPLAQLQATLLRQGGRVPLPYQHRSLDDAPHTLLVLDDDNHVLNALVRLLRQENYRILAASTTEEAFHLLAQEPIQVALVDHRMPGMGGTAFLKRLREIHPQVVRMIFSGYPDVQALSDAVNRGAVYRFVLKPWDDDALRRMIRDAFRHYQGN